MSEFQVHTSALADTNPSIDWLSEVSAQARADWQAASWPTRKTEHFKYIPLSSLQKDLPALATQASGFSVEGLDLLPIDATRLVFVDGVFSPENSSDLVAGIELFSDVSSSTQELVESTLNTLIDRSKHLFVSLNTALLRDGVVVQVNAHTQLEKPLYIVNVSTGQYLSSPRLLVVVGANSTAEIIEHYVTSTEDAAPVVNAVSELFVGDNAQLTHYRINFEEENARHIGAMHIELLRSARFRGFALSLGSRFNRVDYQVNHRGEGAEVDLQGLYLPRNKQVVDYHTNLCHWVPHCTSSEVFRGIIGDSAHAVFNGRIYIHPDAQKTLAELSNKNMLTSNQAEINTKPELEIYADDVKCAHGATVSQLNANARYYLQSRGLSRTEAEVMLSFGFVNELLEQVQNKTLHDFLLPRLAARFGRDQSLLMAEAE
jgi:Fe-S cluster assembly protein SufD